MWTKRQGTVQILDANDAEIGTPVDVGDFTVDSLEEGGVSAVRVMARGRHIGAVEGDDTLPSGSLTVGLQRESLTHATNFRIWDAIHKTGAVASAVTTNPIASGPFMCRLKFNLEQGPVTGEFVLDQVRLTANLSESGEYTQFAVSFTGILDADSVV